MNEASDRREFADDPCAFTIMHWVYIYKVRATFQWEDGITDIIKDFVEIKGVFGHSNIKQMMAIAKWAKAWTEYEMKRDNIITQWQSDEKKTWKCRCGITNNTKETIRMCDDRGIVLKCAAKRYRYRCSEEEKILITKPQKDEIMGEPFKTNECGKIDCHCMVFEDGIGSTPTCKCGHWSSYHTDFARYADEWDGTPR